MADLGAVCRMAADNADLADFILVYIEEAHAADGWAVAESGHQINTHRSLEDRLAAATRLANAITLPSNMTLVVDTMSDELNRAYGALPERMYVIHDGLVVYQGRMGPFFFSPAEVDDWLKMYRERMSASNDDNIAKDEASS